MSEVDNSPAARMRAAGITPCSRCEVEPVHVMLGMLGPLALSLCTTCEAHRSKTRPSYKEMAKAILSWEEDGGQHGDSWAPVHLLRAVAEKLREAGYE